MGRVYALANQKGGVGKTTTAVSLAAALAQRGQRVLLVDLDPQANATSSLGVDKNVLARSVYELLIDAEAAASLVMLSGFMGLDLIPATPGLAGAEIELVEADAREQRLRRGLAGLRSRYDYVLIDTPPSLGLLTLNAHRRRWCHHPGAVRVFAARRAGAALAHHRAGAPAAQPRSGGAWAAAHHV